MMKSIKITRFGKLLPEKQSGNFGKDGYHNAPEAEGFYCFNTKFIEHFLVGEKIYERDVYHADIVDGYIWIHLTPPKRNYIIAQCNDWYKIRVQDYNKILTSVYNSEVTWYECGTAIKYAKDHLEIFCTKETILKNVRKGFNKYKTRGQEKSSEFWDANEKRWYDTWKFNNDLRQEQKEKYDEERKD